jgi:multidrug efflux system membrane fusion protein
MSAGHELPVEAWDSKQKRKLALGTVMTLDNMVDTNSGTIRLRAGFTNQDLVLFPNQFVNATLLLRTEHNATLIPYVAVQHSTDGAFVYVVTNETAAVRPIKEGPTDGELTSVQGVEPGDVVVTYNFNRLLDGIKVTVAKPEEPTKQYAGKPEAGARGKGGGRGAGADGEGGGRSGKAKKVAAKRGPAADE